jgi:hypothetical protein
MRLRGFPGLLADCELGLAGPPRVAKSDESGDEAGGQGEDDEYESGHSTLTTAIANFPTP